MKKFLIIGYKCHGKTSFAHFLQSALGEAQAFSTSDYLIYRLALLKGVDEAVLRREKEKYRADLIDLGNLMCEADAGCLVSMCLWACHKEVAIIDGVRRLSEYDNVKNWFDRIIWIRRPQKYDGKDNLQLTAEHAHEVIENDGDLKALEKKAQDFAKRWKD